MNLKIWEKRAARALFNRLADEEQHARDRGDSKHAAAFLRAARRAWKRYERMQQMGGDQ